MSDPLNSRTKRRRIPISRFIPTIREIEESSSNSTSSEENDSDFSEKETSKKQSITFSQFNSYNLQEKQEAIHELIESTTIDSLKEKLLDIDNVLNFLSQYDSINLPDCFELSVYSPNMHMTSINGSKRKNLLNASISNKTIKFFNKNSKLGEFFDLLKKFNNVTINILKKSSSKVFDKLVEKIQEYKQFNIVLTIDEAVIEESEFENNTIIKSVILSPSVKTIEKHAFFNCQSLEKVTFSDSLKKIGVGAFQNCTSLQKAIIPDSVTTMSAFAFCNCSSLTKVFLSSSMKSIKIGAFKDCQKLRKVQIPDSISSIGKMAFKSCISLVRITIPDSVTSISDLAFSNCSSLSQIKVSKSVRYGCEPFKNCTALIKNPALAKSSENRPKNKRSPRARSSVVESSEDSDEDDDSF